MTLWQINAVSLQAQQLQIKSEKRLQLTTLMYLRLALLLKQWEIITHYVFNHCKAGYFSGTAPKGELETTLQGALDSISV